MIDVLLFSIDQNRCWSVPYQKMSEPNDRVCFNSELSSIWFAWKLSSLYGSQKTCLVSESFCIGLATEYYSQCWDAIQKSLLTAFSYLQNLQIEVLRFIKRQDFMSAGALKRKRLFIPEEYNYHPCICQAIICQTKMLPERHDNSCLP